MLLMVAFGPLVWQVAINDIDFTPRLQTPTWAHPFGTDDLGQDMLARMLYGGRISLCGRSGGDADGGVRRRD